MSQEELLKAQVRMTAMQSAVTLFCCTQGHGAGTGSGIGITPRQLEELLPRLMELRDMLLQTALKPGPI